VNFAGMKKELGLLNSVLILKALLIEVERDIVMKNWLLNPSGLPNRFVEMDLVQEHLNLRVKVQSLILIYDLRFS